MAEVGLIGLRRVAFHQRHIAIGIRDREPAELRQDDSLNHREALLCAIRQVLRRLFPIQTMKQFPGGVAQVEERLAILVLEVAPVVADSDPGGDCAERVRGGAQGETCDTQHDNAGVSSHWRGSSWQGIRARDCWRSSSGVERRFSHEAFVPVRVPRSIRPWILAGHSWAAAYRFEGRSLLRWPRRAGFVLPHSARNLVTNRCSPAGAAASGASASATVSAM